MTEKMKTNLRTAKALFDQGKSCAEVGKAMGVSRGRAGQYRKELGITGPRRASQGAEPRTRPKGPRQVRYNDLNARKKHPELGRVYGARSVTRGRDREARIVIRIAHEKREPCESAAEFAGVSLSVWVREAMQEKLEREQKKLERERGQVVLTKEQHRRLLAAAGEGDAA